MGPDIDLIPDSDKRSDMDVFAKIQNHAVANHRVGTDSQSRVRPESTALSYDDIALPVSVITNLNRASGNAVAVVNDGIRSDRESVTHEEFVVGSNVNAIPDHARGCPDDGIRPDRNVAPDLDILSYYEAALADFDRLHGVWSW